MKEKQKRPKQTYTPKTTYRSFDEAFQMFIDRNCVPASFGTIGVKEDPYINVEIRIVLNATGSGYIYLLGQDSETIDFVRLR